MRVLVASAAYPTCDGGKAQYYVHSRNLYYVKEGIMVRVLNFSATCPYEIDGIPVYGLNDFKLDGEKYDLLICHAANIRNHYIFIQKYGRQFEKIVFFYHGHEILHINRYYPQPYIFQKSKIPVFVQNRYDDLKLFLWKKYIWHNREKIRLVFVSNWIYEQFMKEFNWKEKNIKKKCTIIPNSVGTYFENHHYNCNKPKYDFITIRNYLDDSKYCVDIVVKLAMEHPEWKFCLIGKGKFFDYVEKPQNIEWIDKEMSHEDMGNYINSAKYALLPTREDTQGVMACELAAYGIPLITSDIEVCREVMKSCPRCQFMSNEAPNLSKAIEELKMHKTSKLWDEYYAKNTIQREIEFINDFVKE